MILRLMCVVIISTIIIEINSSPVLRNVDSFELNNDCKWGCGERQSSSETDPAPYEISNSAGPIQKAMSNTFRTMRRNTFMFIDNTGEALETAVKLTKYNLLKTMASVREALKANVDAAQNLGELAVNTVAQIPAFGLRILQNPSKNPEESQESDDCLE